MVGRTEVIVALTVLAGFASGRGFDNAWFYDGASKFPELQFVLWRCMGSSWLVSKV